MAAGGCGGTSPAAECEFIEHFGPTDCAHRPSADCEAAAGAQPAAVVDPGLEGSEGTPAVQAGPDEEPAVESAAPRSDSLSAAAAVAAAADQGDEVASYCLEDSSAGSSHAAEGEEHAEAAVSSEGKAVAKQSASQEHGGAAKGEALQLQSASSGQTAGPPAAVLAECSSGSLAAATASDEEVLLREEAAASSAAGAASPAATTAMSGTSSHPMAAPSAECSLRASITSSAASSAGSEACEKGEPAAAPDAPSLGLPAAAEASGGEEDLRASVNSLASTAGSDEAAAEAMSDAGTGADLCTSAASAGSRAAAGSEGGSAEGLAAQNRQQGCSIYEDEGSCSSAAAQLPVHAAQAAVADELIAAAGEGAGTCPLRAEESAEKEVTAAPGEEAASAMTEGDRWDSAVIEAEAAAAEVKAAEAEAENIHAAAAAQLAAAQAKLPGQLAGLGATALAEREREAAGPADSLDAAVPAVGPARFSRQAVKAPSESLVLQGSVCTLVHPGERM